MKHEKYLVAYKEIGRFEQALRLYFSGEMDADRFQAGGAPTTRRLSLTPRQHEHGDIKMPGGRLVFVR